MGVQLAPVRLSLGGAFRVSDTSFDLWMKSSLHRYGNHLSQRCVESGGKSGRYSSAVRWRTSRSIYIIFNDVFMRQERMYA